MRVAVMGAGEDVAFISVQNGIDNAERIAQIVGAGPIIGGVAYVFATIEAPGIIAQTAGPGKIPSVSSPAARARGRSVCCTRSGEPTSPPSYGPTSASPCGKSS